LSLKYESDIPGIVRGKATTYISSPQKNDVTAMRSLNSDEILISGIIPTVGRADYLRKCLETVTAQTLKPREIVVVHCGTDEETPAVVADPRWTSAGIDCRYFHHPERNAAAQRNFAVQRAKYPWLLLLDDDLELEPEWTENLLRPLLEDSTVAAAVGCCTNQPPLIFDSKTWLWHHYLVTGRSPQSNEGKVIGAVVNVGFHALPTVPTPMEWMSGGASAVRRSMYEAVGGFAPYFTGSSHGEDFDLGYRLSRRWKVLFTPTARAYHHSAGQGREPRIQTEYHTIRSRFAIQVRAMGRSRVSAQLHSLIYMAFQSLSELIATLKGKRLRAMARLRSRLSGWLSCWLWNPPPSNSYGQGTSVSRSPAASCDFSATDQIASVAK
jgi:GT2 family glycosyltransferase